jgi:hypothetical protein
MHHSPGFRKMEFHDSPGRVPKMEFHESPGRVPKMEFHESPGRVPKMEFHESPGRETFDSVEAALLPPGRFTGIGRFTL